MPDPYLSEVKYLGGPSVDFIEVAVDAGTDVSNLVVTIYNANGTIRSSNSLAGMSFTTAYGKDIYIIDTITSSSFDGVAKWDGVALSQGSTVYSFVSFTDNAADITATEGPASGLTSTEIGQSGGGSSLETTNGGTSYVSQPSPTPGTIPCLTNGTRVETDKGQVLVEDLQLGARILCADGSYSVLKMVLRKAVAQAEFQMNEKLAPVRITAGALGRGLPQVDLLVSRQHRMLMQSRIVERMFNVPSVLVAAIRMVDIPGIYVDQNADDLEYFHLLLDSHSVIFAEGAPTESFLAGPQILENLPADVVDEMNLLFPQFSQTDVTPEPARLIPKGKLQKQLVARHRCNKKGVLEKFDPLPGMAMVG